MRSEGTMSNERGCGLWADDARVPLTGVELRGELLGAHVHVRSRQTYVNGEKAAIESVYTFPVPSDATLTGFRMESGGRVVEGVVAPRDEAFRAYDDAVVTGHGAALLEQQRKNVFSAQVGNLLPGEQTIVEIDYVQRVGLDEGSMRVMIPTLVAPRYAPDATTALASPPVGEGAPNATLALVVDLGRAVEITSPSHQITVSPLTGHRAQVSFTKGAVAQDRDIVLEIRGAGVDQLATVASHRASGGEGWVALSVLPDLLRFTATDAKREITFLIDTSGSMEGDSIVQAKAALRLCLRHLRAGDRFNVVAFDSQHRWFSPTAAPFSQSTLEAADRWVGALSASGGTELLAPLGEAVKQSPDGVIVLLTDGQVSNEREILAAALAQRSTARVYSFGIGTAVSDQLLRDLATETHGAVEFIHPGERIEDKVVAVFSKAIAARVDELSLTLDGVELAELAPQRLPPLVDAEPWTVFARIERGTTGKATLRGQIGREPFTLDVPLSLPDGETNPMIAKLWASARIADLERMKLDGRRADAMKARITELSIAHGVASAYTSFVVVEQREGERRRAGGAPETRVIPVHAPAGWALFTGDELVERARTRKRTGRPMAAMGPPPAGYAPPSPAPMSPAPMSPAPMFARAAMSAAHPPPPPPPMPSFSAMSPAEEGLLFEDEAPDGPLADRIVAQQLASGLWNDDATTAGLWANAEQLWALAEISITTAHPMFGTPLKKALAALIALVRRLPQVDADAATLALGAAWLVASGRRTRGEVEAVAASVLGASARWMDEEALRATLRALAARA